MAKPSSPAQEGNSYRPLSCSLVRSGIAKSSLSLSPLGSVFMVGGVDLNPKAWWENGMIKTDTAYAALCLVCWCWRTWVPLMMSLS